MSRPVSNGGRGALRFGSACSGIGAPEVAWSALGWEPAWFSEIEPYPSAVLAHHWPKTPNLGDMTFVRDYIRFGEVEAPEVLVGGTPCQAFSVAGRRDSLEDERGQLTLEFVKLADAIDEVRREHEQPECVIVWENVPGVLNTKDNAFGCLLGALAGEDGELQPAGKRWTNAGCVFGPERTVAWRILDAQYFGVAQRRRRVFVVASARAGFDPAEVLFESEGVRRDTPPSREAGQSTTHDVAPSLTASGRGVERCGDTRGQDPVVAMPILEPGARTGKSTTDIRTGIGIGEDGDPMFTLQAGKQQGVAHSVSLRGREGGATAELGGEVAGTLRASTGGGDKPHVLTGYRMAAFGECADDETASTMKARDYKDATDLAVHVVHGTQDPDLSDNRAHTLGRNSGQENAVFAFAENSRAEIRLEGGDGSRTGALSTGGGKPGQGTPSVFTPMAVRRLTPVECERLQGFPDGHTDVPYRGKPAADGPRYKAIGNSKAVPVVHWLGRRIDAELRRLEAEEDEL